MNVGDRVSITDAQRTHDGTVVTVKEHGMVTVKWDSGMTELVHTSELAVASPDDEEAYAADNPKHPTFRERVSSFWDSIAGK